MRKLYSRGWHKGDGGTFGKTDGNDMIDVKVQRKNSMPLFAFDVM
jgi:hypothetical protein